MFVFMLYGFTFLTHHIQLEANKALLRVTRPRELFFFFIKYQSITFQEPVLITCRMVPEHFEQIGKKYEYL